MAKTLQFRRDSTANLASVTGAVGEIFIDTTKKTVVVMDGSTAGGYPLELQGAGTGATGVTGASGVGSNGATGVTGASGTIGVDGATGVTGASGVGATGAAGTDGATGVTGASGSQGIQGASGATGPTGNNGVNGATGTAGASGAISGTGIVPVTYYLIQPYSYSGGNVTIDVFTFAEGSFLDVGMKILVTAQVDPSQNGLYTVTTVDYMSGVATLVRTTGYTDITAAFSDAVFRVTDGNFIGTVKTTSVMSGSIIFSDLIADGASGATGYLGVFYATNQIVVGASGATGILGATGSIRNQGQVNTGALHVGTWGATSALGATGEIRATNEITAYFASDERLKENILPIDNALGKLRQLKGVMFDWKDDVVAGKGGEDGYFVRKHDTGVIAQEVEAVLPEVVAERADGFKAVRYEKLAGLIIQAINELADQVDALKK